MILIYFALLPFYLIKLMRWISIFQQKEYRLDRFFLFLGTGEGVAELKRIPEIADFTLQGFRRPVKTARAVVLIFASLCLLMLIYIYTFSIVNPYRQLWILLLVYLLLPCLVLVSDLLDRVLFDLYSLLIMAQARKKLQARKPLIVGITGSFAKTSTKYLIAHILAKKYKVFTTPKSHNTKYSIAKNILQDYKNQEVVILEYAAYKQGEIKKLTNYFPPQTAVITGITKQHLGLFGNLGKIIDSKAELAAAISPNGRCFFPAESGLAKKVCANCQGKIIAVDETLFSQIGIGQNGELYFSYREIKVNTRLIGRHYLRSIALAVALAEDLGLKPRDIAAALSSFTPDDSFIKSAFTAGQALLLDDSPTANPKGFEAICSLAAELKIAKKYLVFGGIVDLGKESDAIHLKLAEKAKSVFDKVFYVGKTGNAMFYEVFKDDFIEDKESLLESLGSASGDSLLVFEGRIPKDIAKIFALKKQ